jgi:sugar phosphate isomerase/epimerase
MNLKASRKVLFVCIVLLSQLSRAETPPSLWDKNNLIAWCVVPGDTQKRTPEQRADMVQQLGFKHYAYDWRDEHVPTFDAEADSILKRGIDFFAWWFPTDAADPHAQMILDVCARHQIHPQLWVMGVDDSKVPHVDQPGRIKWEADRIRKLVELAAPYHCKIEIYNYQGWISKPTNEMAVLDLLKTEGIPKVGIIYNFSHAQGDKANFTAIWKDLEPYVAAVNLSGVSLAKGDLLYLTEGDQELNMMRTIQQSGWQGPIGIISDRNIDSEVALKKNLQGFAVLSAKLQSEAPAAAR